MILEFPSEQEAKNYVPRLKSKDKKRLNKILRFKSILFSFTLRDFHNTILHKGSDLLVEQWINQTIKRIKENLWKNAKTPPSI